MTWDQCLSRLLSIALRMDRAVADMQRARAAGWRFCAGSANEVSAGSSGRAPTRNASSNLSEVGGSSPSPLTKFRPFQIRWREPLGRPECPYLYRWTLLFAGFSIRLHHWIRSDDKRFFHDHACDFISIILKGRYTNVTPEGRFPVAAGSVWCSTADKRHYLDIPKGGAWTLLLCGRPWRKWGFWVNEHKWRPLRYFHKYGIPGREVQ